jgi:putative transposase
VEHDRRRILHFNATKHPTGAWVTQQLRGVFPYDSAPRYLPFDRAANFSEEVDDAIKSFSIEPKRTSFQSPWQNGVAERFVGTGRGFVQLKACGNFGRALTVKCERFFRPD